MSNPLLVYLFFGLAYIHACLNYGIYIGQHFGRLRWRDFDWTFAMAANVFMTYYWGFLGCLAILWG